MPSFDIGNFENGLDNSRITSQMVTNTVDSICDHLLKIPRFKQLLEVGADTWCPMNFKQFPTICQNTVTYSQPTENENITNLKADIREQVLTRMDVLTQKNNWNHNKTFNYYTNQYDYFFHEDLKLIQREVIKSMTDPYYNTMYTKFNKLASNPWNHEKTKSAQQQHKINSITSEKLSAPRTYNPIPDFFI